MKLEALGDAVARTGQLLQKRDLTGPESEAIGRTLELMGRAIAAGRFSVALTVRLASILDDADPAAVQPSLRVVK